ncbi:MAG: class I SAM-dependent methyltransferase [Rhodospirillaceae bacterium]|nr:class I SAM-dependent methyltransferase [Rhodospirillaceae bacterium]
MADDGGFGRDASVYDLIGRTYTATRAPDRRIHAQILDALADARSVLNVGAGAGSYEPTDRDVVAIEPSARMIAQRGAGQAPVVRAVAEALPFRDRSFDAVMAILTLHHWRDQARGLGELRRVSRGRIVILTVDAAINDDSFWLTRDYLPDIKSLHHGRFWPPAQIITALGGGRVAPVPVPADCRDGFLCAFWRRPEAYLDPAVRDGISCFPLLPAPVVDAAMSRLAADLESGAWRARNGDLVARTAMDFGYRLIVAG